MIKRFLRWLFSEDAPQQDKPPEPQKRDGFFSTEIDLDDILTREQRMQMLGERVLPVPKHHIVTDNGFAMDSSDGSVGSSLKGIYSLNQVGIPEVQAMWYGSQGFIGYQLCALIAQHWLVKKACLIPARDAIRKGYKFTVNDGTQVATEVMDAIKKANKRFRLNRSLIEFVNMGRVFGIRIAMFIVDSTDPDYYVKPFNPDGVTPGSYKGISQIDPYWCVPELSVLSASDPSAIDFYEPTYWVINGRRIHKSHLVVMRGPDVGDILKPSYLYGGLSVPQMIYERVYAAERTANEAPQLALTKRAMIFYTDTSKALANQAQFEQRLNIWTHFRDNYGVKVADKEADLIDQKDTSLSDLDAVIMTQYQIVAAAANIPATKLLGTTPKGFNSSGDYETDSYHEELESIQTEHCEPMIDRHMTCLIRSEIAPRFGIKPFATEVVFEPLATLSAEQQAAINKTKAETDKVLADAGAIDGLDIRRRVAADEMSEHNGLEIAEDSGRQEAQDEQLREENGQFGGSSGGSSENGSSESWGNGGKKIEDSIKSILEDDDTFSDFGLRVMHEDDRSKIGDVLASSHRWEDGDRTDEELEGTSTIGVTTGNLKQAIRDINQYRSVGTRVVLVRGERKGSGEDPGEDLIKDAEVVKEWKL